MTVLIAGGGISGLALALSCHQVGIPCKVFESSPMMQPLGVGINLQPSAVRELYALGLSDRLGEIGVQTRDYGFYTKFGLHIWTEPRGMHLGYKWPQYSVHRGQLHMMLYEEVLQRCGADTVRTGVRVIGFENEGDQAALYLKDSTGEEWVERGAVAIGADGIHSAIRAQLQPDEGPPSWGGSILWRGTTQAEPFLTGASMVLVGHHSRRFVSYPISPPDPKTGKATINWICERSFDPSEGFKKEDYAREADPEQFLPHFEGFQFDWLDAVALIRGAEKVFEYPMVDRDPLDHWTQGRVTLMGDAAHAAYPVGSNGAGAGIIDARKLVAAFLNHGLNETALQAYEAEMLPETSKIVLMNRGSGPDKILDLVEERSGGQFDDIEDVIPKAEMDEYGAAYKRSAGFGVSETNERPDIVPVGAKYEGRV